MNNDIEIDKLYKTYTKMCFYNRIYVIHRERKYRYNEQHNCRNCGVNELLNDYMCQTCNDNIDDELNNQLECETDLYTGCLYNEDLSDDEDW
jgi:superfamily II helicase